MWIRAELLKEITAFIVQELMLFSWTEQVLTLCSFCKYH